MYTREEYMEKVALFRSIYPEVVLGTDIIVGFPTETDEEFQMTYDALKEIEYGVAFLFEYSPRKGTPAMRFKDDIPDSVKSERHRLLFDLQEEIMSRHRQAMLGTEVEVLVEGVTERDDAFLKGRTRCWKNVVFKGNKAMIGSLQRVSVKSFNHHTLIGELASEVKSRESLRIVQ